MGDMEAGEIAQDQPILYAILIVILRIVNKNGAVTEERVIPKDGNNAQKGRRIDFVVDSTAEYLAAILPAQLERSIEVKVVGGKHFKKYQESAKNQTIGNQSRRLKYSFNFGGIGEDSCSLGIVLTMASVTVYEVKLSNVGTSEVELKSRKSECLQLIRNDMYKDVPASDSKDGFLMLAGALMALSSTGETVCKNLFHDNTKSLKLEYLGSGAFCHTVQMGKQDFLKIPKSAEMEKTIQIELNILKILDSKREDIPKLYGNEQHKEPELFNITLSTRVESSTLKGLRLKGMIGTASSSLMPIKDYNIIYHIIKKVHAALSFAHGKEVYHLDVRPGNIIINVPKKQEKQEMKVMLIDWGCSLHGTGTLTSFRGCTPYAHDSLLGNKNKVSLSKELDHASLVYSMSHLDEGRLKWSGFSGPTKINTDMLENRRNCVIGDIKKWEEEGLDDNIVKDFKGATGVNYRRSPRNQVSNQ